MKLRHALFTLEGAKSKIAKKYADEESDLDEDFIVEHEENLKAKEIEKAEKKFAKDNEKLAAEDKKPLKESVLKERIEAIEEEFKALAKERGTQRHELKRDRPADKLIESIDKLTDKIKAFKLQMQDKDEGKEVALSTRYVQLNMVVVRELTNLQVKSTTLILESRSHGATHMMFPSRRSSPRPCLRNVRGPFLDALRVLTIP